MDARQQKHPFLLHDGRRHLDLRVGGSDGETKLVQIDIATGTTTPVPAGPGIKIFPSVLPSGEFAYVRRRNSAPGIFYASGKPGPAGPDLCSPSWSPDGVHVVYSRYTRKPSRDTVKLWSPNPNFEISGTTFLAASDPAGGRFATTNVNPDMSSTLVIVDEGKPARSIFDSKELMLAPQWSPDSRQIVFGVGGFSAFLDFAIGGKKQVDPINGGAQVAIINADGTGFRLITSGPNNNAFASFTSDGKHIVYRTAARKGKASAS